MLNASFKENIIFGRAFESDKYQEILEACALQQDIERLPDKDESEIGERGTNISGGQKQRIGIARAVYSDADLFIFDDPFSAVDADVAEFLFERVIGKTGVLKTKTRILITHSLNFLQLCDRIVYISEGKIQNQGCNLKI